MFDILLLHSYDYNNFENIYFIGSLEEAINEFKNDNGAGIIISHDRFFLNRVCTHTLAFEPIDNIQGESNVIYYRGNFQKYNDNKGK